MIMTCRAMMTVRNEDRQDTYEFESRVKISNNRLENNPKYSAGSATLRLRRNDYAHAVGKIDDWGIRTGGGHIWLCLRYFNLS